MSSRPDVVVVGGGIAGLAVTLALADRGHRVRLLDDARGGAASRASAGMLAPSLGFAPHIRALAIVARDCYPPLVDRLRDATGITVPLDRQGIIELAADAGALAERHASAGPGAVRLDAEMLRRAEPLLAQYHGALLHPLDGAVDVRVLMDALERAVDLSPLAERVRGEVTGLRVGRADAAAVTVDGTVHAGARLVLAAGVWASQLPGLPRQLPVRPVHGQLILLAGASTAHVVHGPDGYLVPRGGGVVVGATSDDVGLFAEATEEGGAALRRAARRMVPSLGDAAVLAHWAGLRPVTPDGLPIVGVDPELTTLAYACGYSRNGVLFAPWAAARLADELMGERAMELDAFRVDRFGSAPVAGGRSTLDN